MNEIVFFLERREATYLARLRALVDINSGLDNPAGRDRVLDHLEIGYKTLGFSCERVQRPGDMTHLVARRPSTKPGATKVLILGHFDTVYDSTSPFQTFTEQGPWLAGPGVGDMKGGLVVTQAALDALYHVGHLGDFDWVCCHNADEEIQSPTSRDLIEQCAADRDLCLDFEIGRKTGAVVRSRSGVGRFFVTVHGRSAHAGMDHSVGVNAIVGLSRIIVELAELTDPARGTTVNVGVVKGGTKRNVVPDEAKAEVDVRVQSIEEGERVERRIRELCGGEPVPGARVELLGGIGRPPWQRNPLCDRLIAHFQRVADEHGLALGAEDTGGGSDANFTAALGIPTIDGLGPVGEKPHTFDERIQRHSVVERAKLVALALLAYKPDRDGTPVDPGEVN
ncbi:MAG: M20 family metallopeptidase [Deltaproteobacteria bacterium]|nr:M20 family metallopeptidase [Deltaproteobacteria bacterium]